jgi:hypothetical protein
MIKLKIIEKVRRTKNKIGTIACQNRPKLSVFVKFGLACCGYVK